MERKKVLIVDDHVVTRIGLRELLIDLYPLIEIVEACDGDSMLEKLKAKKIDLIILDIQMDNTDTIRLVEMLSIKSPKTNILIFSMLSEKIYGRRLLNAGAKGFLTKSAPLHEIKKAIDTVLESKKYISPLLGDIIAHNPIEERSSDPFSVLSQREFEIAHDLLSGSSMNTISQKLNIKPSTVGTYKSRIFEKLSVHNMFELKDLATLYEFSK